MEQKKYLDDSHFSVHHRGGRAGSSFAGRAAALREQIPPDHLYGEAQTKFCQRMKCYNRVTESAELILKAEPARPPLW